MTPCRRPVAPGVYSITEWGRNDPWLWAAAVRHLWRTTGDISDNYGTMLSIMKQDAVLDEYPGPGHWNDPDMLEVGSGGMTDTEYRSHFSLCSTFVRLMVTDAADGTNSDHANWAGAQVTYADHPTE